jgi:hypothetical protein
MTALKAYRLLADYEAKIAFLQSSSHHLRALLGLCGQSGASLGALSKLGSVVKNAHEAVEALDKVYELVRSELRG